MKIAVDVRMMNFSGIGSYIRHLVPLVIQSSPKTEFYLLGRPQEMNQCKGFAKSSRVQWIETTSPIFTISEQFELSRKIPKDTDLFWSPNYNFPVLWRGKLLVTVHDVFHLVMGKGINSVPKWFYARLMFNRLIRRADALLCVSQFTKSELVRLTGALPSKIKAIYNGVDGSWFKIKRRKNPHPLPYLLFVGNIKPHKNLGALLEAFTRLKDKIPHDLVLVGQREGFITGDKSVLEKAKSMKGRVYFTGIVNETLLGQYYAFADMLVFPSLYEGFGLPPLEAMACGCPTAVSQAGSLPEVCGQATEYFDPKNTDNMAVKILKVLQNKRLREKLIKEGIKQARQFTWNECVKQTCQVIDSLLIKP
jgi:glycosyltransferase involved in cell wall biosynthesis